MRQGTSKIGTAAPYGAGTRVAVHRSRFELERTLGRYGASDFALVEEDATASIQFAMQGRYVQLALPLPDPNDARFTQTPSGRSRTVVAQERAYEQALREHWRALLLAVRGKLQSVESGISTFEHEFAEFLVSQPHAERHGSRKRKKPKAVNWLLGSSHTVAIGLVAAFLVPASAVGAFALPPSVVDNLSAPFRSALPDEVGSGGDSGSVTIALGSNSWTAGENESDVSARRRGQASTFVPENAASQAADQLAEAALASAAEEHAPVASQSGGAPPAVGGGSESSSSQQASPGKPEGGNLGKPDSGANPPAASESGGATSSPPALPDEDAPGQAAGPSGGSNEDEPSAGEPAAGNEESSGDSTAGEPGSGNGNNENGNNGNNENGNNGNHGNGNNGNGNDNANAGSGNSGNGNGNANAGNSNNGNGNANPPENANGNGNGNGNANPAGNANGNDGNGNNGGGNNGNGNGNAVDPANPGKGKAKATP